MKTEKLCTKCSTVRPRSCFKTRSDGSMAAYCIDCEREYHKEYAKKNSLKRKQIATEWNKNNPERRKKIARESNARLRKTSGSYDAKALSRYRKWVSLNRDKARQIGRTYRIKNKVALQAYNSYRRRGCKAPWYGELDDLVIKEAYDLASRRKAVTGFEWQVDHIVPLKSKYVCGLHCASNVAVIPKAENLAKGNRYWPDTLEIV